MPWRERGVLEERFEFVEQWSRGDWSVAELCRYFGLTRKTGYKWLQRYEEEGLTGLQDRSRAPTEQRAER